MCFPEILHEAACEAASKEYVGELERNVVRRGSRDSRAHYPDDRLWRSCLVHHDNSRASVSGKLRSLLRFFRSRPLLPALQAVFNQLAELPGGDVSGADDPCSGRYPVIGIKRLYILESNGLDGASKTMDGMSIGVLIAEEDTRSRLSRDQTWVLQALGQITRQAGARIPSLIPRPTLP